MFDLSICIPLFNEENTIPELVERLGAAISEMQPLKVQVVFIDDGSRDGTGEKVLSHGKRLSSSTLISFSRNFGHQSALQAGLAHAQGEIVCIMDGDLQDEPEHIRPMLALLNDGHEIVYAVRGTRKASIVKTISYKMYYRLLRNLASIDIPLDAGDFCVMRRQVVNELCSLPEYHKFYRGLRAWVGFSQVGYLIDRPGRTFGESKYTFRKLIQLSFAGIFSFSTVPLYLCSAAGAGAVILSFLFALYSVALKIFTDRSPTGFAALIIIVVFLGGVQLIFLGILGSYIGYIFEQVKERPSYIIKKIDQI